MSDREKVIRGLEYCESHLNCTHDCPYWKDCFFGVRHQQLIKDIQELLKEQDVTPAGRACPCPAPTSAAQGSRYTAHCLAVLERAKEEGNGLRCVLSVSEADCIIDLLKELEPVEPFIEVSARDRRIHLRCGACKRYIKNDDWFCSRCGKEVKHHA